MAGKGSPRPGGAGRPLPGGVGKANLNFTTVQVKTVGGLITRLGGGITSPLLLGGLNNLANNVPLSAGQVGAVNAFLEDPANGLTAGEQDVLEQGVAVSTSPGDDEAAAAVDTSLPEQVERFLRVKNDTGQKLRVRIQYRGLNADKTGYEWLPADPAKSTRGLVYEFDPGETTYLALPAGRIKATRVRLWAVAANGEEWADYKTQDLWLVDETDAEGQHVYHAEEVETYDFTFAP